MAADHRDHAGAGHGARWPQHRDPARDRAQRQPGRHLSLFARRALRQRAFRPEADGDALRFWNASGSFEFVAFSGGVNGRLTIPKYESHHPVCLDVEWLLPTLFDASLLTFEPPSGRLFFWSAARIIGQGRGATGPDHGTVNLNDMLPRRRQSDGVILAMSRPVRRRVLRSRATVPIGDMG
ncbi:hypothetical protein BOSE62_160039 [Bosea sp. 62]|nr:hypothetical protein BOSE46_10280 [Bosea sp. 46]CAD5249821.1 hypothetical protein BOSE21B_10486 [Bosea sp. 21B]CAD5266183.1 hypothetical protein BOSE7B_150650 [Bosea sp. 7B]VVT44790.1 hypothetical protein BOS5A_10589 [Bosea sp. EC-HK365B]VXB03946.1 hypothetical protein BOSE29B_10277 [Bosea sp. 29B]VXB04005.1 hypothetical protein BOSE125_10277 [Bosea sp. 125]VXB86250.1 hypothetical protein BOSE62_160039 [Bosea sp. 62]VXC50224.1 hypothetical protein BOSE127_190277 [Bosea sp. 127]